MALPEPCACGATETTDFYYARAKEGRTGVQYECAPCRAAHVLTKCQTRLWQEGEMIGRALADLVARVADLERSQGAISARLRDHVRRGPGAY